jgi:hypothetical protein
VAAPGRGGPDDALLRDLYAGTAAYYAGRWAESDAALARAAVLADDRFTRSASRAALALLTNDLALAYVPGANERLFVHYYGLLGRLRRGDAEGAAVEARRMAFLLQQADDEGRDPLDVATRGTLRYLSGVAFEADGDSDDAAVAYRNAAALLGPAMLARDPARATTPDRSTGEVVVVVEQGFVAHRVGEALSVRVDSDGDWDLLLAGDGNGNGNGRTAVLGRVASLLTDDRGLWADELPRELRLGDPLPPAVANGGWAGQGATVSAASLLRAAAGPHAAVASGDGGEGQRHSRAPREVLRVVWPAYRRPRPLALPAVTIARDSGALALAAFAALAGPVAAARPASAAPSAVPVSLVARAELSDAIVADFKRDRTVRLARLLVRAATRAAAAERAGKKHHELADLVAGLGRAVERADTRSWHLLPGRIVVARLRLPAGRQAVTVDVGGTVASLGEVDVPAGGIAVATGRVY